MKDKGASEGHSACRGRWFLPWLLLAVGCAAER